MEIKINELVILLVVFIPFLLAGIYAILGTKIGFFQTEEIKILKHKDLLYFDKIFGKRATIFIILIFIMLVVYAFLSSYTSLQDKLIIITIWLSFVFFRWTYGRLKILENFIWDEYANHTSKYNPATKKYDSVDNKFRINYPTPPDFDTFQELRKLKLFIKEGFQNLK